MGTCTTSGGSKAEGYTEIKDKDGNLLVAFSSEDAETPWGQRFQAARIRYSMLKRRETIPMWLRTGKRPRWIPFWLRRQTLKLEKAIAQIERNQKSQ